MRSMFLVLMLLSGPAAALSYRVQPGDTLSGLAARAGVSQRQLRQANPQLSGHVVRVGQVLKLPLRQFPVHQLPAQKYHVQRGENLTTIARKFQLSPAQLLRANPVYRGGRNIWAGAVLTIPARLASAQVPSQKVQTVKLRSSALRQPVWLWPLPGYHRISSGYGPRVMEGKRAMHYGVDVAAPVGTPVLAARSGRVLESRLDAARGWGWTVVLAHPDGWITRYAHLSQNLVKRGERVRRGQKIGRVGNTGHTTGPHLHFGTYLRWVPRDPLSLYR